MSGGGVTYAWNSSVVIVLLVLGGVLFIAFVIYEAKVAKLPIMPSKASHNVPHFSASLHNPFSSLDSRPNLSGRNRILRQSLLFACILSSSTEEDCNHVWSTFTSPDHHSNIHGHWSRYLLGQVRQIKSVVNLRTGRYNPVIWAGFALWTLGLGIQTTFSPDISVGKVIGYLIVEGFGIGMTFQTSIRHFSIPNHSLGCRPSNVLQERSRCRDGSEEFLPYHWGCLWSCKYLILDPKLIVVCGAIMNNVLESRLATQTDLSQAVRQQIIRSSLDLPKNLTSAQIETVQKAYVIFSPWVNLTVD